MIFDYQLNQKKVKIRMILLAMPLVANLSCSNQTQENNCQQFDKVDLEMLNMIAVIEKEYQADKAFIKAFKESQIYWIQYRNRHIKAVYPLSPKKYNYDVGDCKCIIYRDLTLTRISELKKWIDGVPAEETCQGTYKVRK